MSKLITSPAVRVPLRVPEDLLDRYAERAAKFGRSVEDELILRLRDCADHTATQGIYLDDTTRQALESLTGKTLRTAGDLLTWAKQTSSLKITGVEIPLGQTLAVRLESRRFGTPWPEHIRSTVTRLLETEAGMR